MDPPTVLLQEDAEFWFDDGTIIIEARSVRFRIYKGILAEHSPVFADMFSIPQPATCDDVSAGTQPCPVMELDDSPDDIRNLLRALLPKKQTPIIYAGPPKIDFETISACVRLGHKYQVDHLLVQSLEYLEHFYPLEFDKWMEDGVSAGPPSWSPSQAIGVVNIARRMEWPTVLRTALTVCCTLPVPTIVNGFVTSGGDVEKLDSRDLIRCMKGKVVLMTEFTGAVLRVFAPTNVPGCTTEGACQRAIRDTLYSLHDQPDCVANEWPFCEASAFLRVCEAYAFPLCSLCYRDMENRMVDEQRTIWGQLPDILGLEAGG
ncbi:hypothetical protein C8T65DRAFT_747543 [Cerioporus squamosus]|nr:hypothetical protein C8T65DRAFT_747543 [Cerioporus squamosus]